MKTNPRSSRFRFRWEIRRGHATTALHVAIAFSACLLGGCGRNGGASDVLARVGERTITIGEFDREMERRATRGQPIPGNKELLQEMVKREAMLVRARKAGLEHEPEVRRMLENVLIGQLRERELESERRNLTVTEDEVKQAYEADIERYTRPAKVRLAVLYAESSPRMSESKRAEIRDRIEDGRRKALENRPSGGMGPAANGFGSLAIEYSEDQTSRYRGGDIGWLDSGSFSYRWPREVLEAGYGLEKGSVSEVLETKDGLYVITKTDFRPGSTTSLADARAQLGRKLLAEKRRLREAEFYRKTMDLAVCEIDPEVLARVKDPPVALADAQGNTHPTGPPAMPGADHTIHNQ